jgi:hypothetical protein
LVTKGFIKHYIKNKKIVVFYRLMIGYLNLNIFVLKLYFQIFFLNCLLVSKLKGCIFFFFIKIKKVICGFLVSLALIGGLMFFFYNCDSI